MKASKLLLTPKERDTAWAKQEDVCEAQVRKAMHVLLHEAERTEATTYVQDFLVRVIKDTGLTWPTKAKE